MNRVLAVPRLTWWVALTALLALAYLGVGLSSNEGPVRWSGVVGALLVLAALAARSRRMALPLLVIGALLPAVTAWWSLVVPSTALMVLVCGMPAIRSSGPAQRAVAWRE